MSDRTVRNGIKELEARTPLTANRQRNLGGGRKSREEEQPTLVAQLESLIEPTTRGDPQSPLKWTCKSLPNLADELQKRGFQVSHTKVGRLLKQAGYSLQANRKTREGIDHPDRNA